MIARDGGLQAGQGAAIVRRSSVALDGLEAPGRLPLSARERLVLTELALGRSTEEMAATIYLSPHTVRSHIKRAMMKLGARTRAQAVAIALADGSIELEREVADPAG